MASRLSGGKAADAIYNRSPAQELLSQSRAEPHRVAYVALRVAHAGRSTAATHMTSLEVVINR